MRSFYDWLVRFYGIVEHYTESTLDEALRTQIATLPNTAEMTALDYACGSGSLTLRLAPHFRTVTGRDQSERMLARARRRAERVGLTVDFRVGNLLAIDEEPDSVDWVFLAFALHLFPRPVEVEILRSLLRVARQGVMIIDHPQTWRLHLAIAERLEGSYYDQFLRADFRAMARAAGAGRFEEAKLRGGVVLVLGKS